MLQVASVWIENEHHLLVPLSVSHASVLKARLDAVLLLLMKTSAVLSLTACCW